jgi:hypothetical protein
MADVSYHPSPTGKQHCSMAVSPTCLTVRCTLSAVPAGPQRGRLHAGCQDRVDDADGDTQRPQMGSM